MEFRSDINGLRAIAVMAVVFYHFAVPGFGGGFVGVDILFVISGFMMTGIIVTALERGDFSLKAFFKSRIRRIVPALMALCAVLLFGGWFILTPSDYEMLGKHAAASLVFISNFIFDNEAGYFDSFSKDKWLLHTWSLSVEWQFYIVLPLVLMALWRLKWQKYLLSILIGLFFISLITSYVMTKNDPSSAFFLLPARIWEFLMGSFVFLLARKCHANFNVKTIKLICFVAAGMIIYAVIFFSEDVAWPGLAAFLPVLGTALLLFFQKSYPAKLLHFPIMQALGLWSYSIYLWHWPLYVALRQFGYADNIFFLAGAILVSVFLGFLSYHFVEKPFRKNAKLKPRLSPKQGGAAFLIVALFALLVDQKDGFQSRVSAQILEIENTLNKARKMRPIPCDSMQDFRVAYPNCEAPEPEPKYIILGDSHADALFVGLRTILPQEFGIGFIKSCPILLNAYMQSKSKAETCPNFLAAAIKAIEALPSAVPLIVSSRFSFYLHGYNEHPDRSVALRYFDIDERDVVQNQQEIFIKKTVETMCALTKTKREVYVLKPVPEIGVEVPPSLSRQIMLRGDDSDLRIALKDYQARHAVVLKALRKAEADCGITLLDPVNYLCDDAYCYGSRQTKPLYYDDDHLSVEGVKTILPLFQSIIKQSGE
jgi:peptidoglycan/LPS O-acetylase OafA/YrhL